MQTFGAKSVVLQFWGKKDYQWKLSISFYCPYDLHHDSSRKATKHFEF